MDKGREKKTRFRGAFSKTDVTVPAATKPPLDSKTTFVVDDQTYEINASNLDTLGPLGQGAHGYVQKMRHRPSGMVMAVKRIVFTTNSTEEQLLLRELDVSMRSANCPFVVHFYGAFFTEGSVWICMEVMDVSLEDFYKQVFKVGQTVPEDVLGVIALSVIKALHYLHSELKVMHRDVKPSNILINRNGRVKICDFGISGRLVNSLAKTQVGSQNYLAPERVMIAADNQGFSVTSDVWSFGISMVEVATGKFPYSNWRTMFDQIKQVVEEEPPRLPPGTFTPEFEDFVAVCLQKDPAVRPKYAQLLYHAFIERSVTANTDISPFVTEIISQISDSSSTLAP